jgi:hypothetical protein
VHYDVSFAMDVKKSNNYLRALYIYIDIANLKWPYGSLNKKDVSIYIFGFMSIS